MRGDRKEFIPEPDGLIRLGQPQPFLFGLPTFRQVTGDFDEAREAIRWVANGREDDICPEARPVLAHSPIFLLESPLLRRNLELSGWLSFLDVLWCEEPR